jgi:hypothetical protein
MWLLALKSAWRQRRWGCWELRPRRKELGLTYPAASKYQRRVTEIGAFGQRTEGGPIRQNGAGPSGVDDTVRFSAPIASW